MSIQDDTGAIAPAKEPKMYAVFRNGTRVSDSEYDSPTAARPEHDYWANIVRRWPDGSKLDIRELYYRRNNYNPSK